MMGLFSTFLPAQVKIMVKLMKWTIYKPLKWTFLIHKKAFKFLLSFIKQEQKDSDSDMPSENN